jgi:transcriptional regulator with XRE-family HTH domain
MNGLLIRRRLFELGQSPEWLADKLGVSASTVQNMLRSRRVHLKTAYKAAKTLDVPIEELAPELAERLGHTPAPNPHRVTAGRA